MSISFLKPVVTPCTAFATRARASPCTARCSSEARFTFRTPSRCSNETPFGMATLNLPLGPCTSTFSEPRAIFTPAGTGIGLFPIRDIFNQPQQSVLSETAKLPNLAKQFAADLVLARDAAAHQSLRGRKNTDAQPADHRLDLVRTDIAALAGA